MPGVHSWTFQLRKLNRVGVGLLFLAPERDLMNTAPPISDMCDAPGPLSSHLKSQELLLCGAGKREPADSSAEAPACQWEVSTLGEYALSLQESPPVSPPPHPRAAPPQGRLGLGVGKGNVAEAWRGSVRIWRWGLPRTPTLLLPPSGPRERLLQLSSEHVREDRSQKAPNNGLNMVASPHPLPLIEKKQDSLETKQNILESERE